MNTPRISVEDVKEASVHMRGMKPFDQYDNRPVIEGKTVLIDKNKFPPRLSHGYWRRTVAFHRGKLPIIISERETPKVGDFAVDYLNGGSVFEIKEVHDDCYIDMFDEIHYTNNDPHQCYKILVLPDQFPTAFMKVALNETTKMLVECEQLREESIMSVYKYFIKLDSTDHAILYPVKKNMIEYEATIGVGDGTGQRFVHGSYDAVKILQKKLLDMEQMVSKEYLKLAYEAGWNDRGLGDHPQDFEAWYDQNARK